jgi:hypothetical protein
MVHGTLFACLKNRRLFAANGSSKKEGLSPSEPPRFKVRLVAKGFSQILRIDYMHSSIHTFLIIVAMQDLELEQLDVNTAFLHGEL